MQGARRLFIAMLACLLILGFSPAPPLSELHTGIGIPHLQEPAKLATECGVAEQSCQDVSERECTLPQARLTAGERLVLPLSSLSDPLAQMAFAPPERPPRLKA